MKDLEIIDIERKGNVVRFYLGKNGNQYGDDWNDVPWRYNCGRVYDQFIEDRMEVGFPFEVDLWEDEDDNLCRNDFIDGKTYILQGERGEKMASLKMGDSADAIYDFIAKIGGVVIKGVEYDDF